MPEHKLNVLSVKKLLLKFNSSKFNKPKLFRKNFHKFSSFNPQNDKSNLLIDIFNAGDIFNFVKCSILSLLNKREKETFFILCSNTEITSEIYLIYLILFFRLL